MRRIVITALMIIFTLTEYASKAQTKPATKDTVTTHHTKTVSVNIYPPNKIIDNIKRFNTYLDTNLKPIAGVHGTVYVNFAAGKDGSITDITIAKSLTKEADDEALRVMKLYPRWDPSTQDGQPVASKTTVVITFK